MKKLYFILFLSYGLYTTGYAGTGITYFHSSDLADTVETSIVISAQKVSPDQLIIDGIETDWEMVDNPVELEYYSVSDEISPEGGDLSAWLKLGWDETCLYGIIRVNDDIMVNSLPDYWENDGIEIVFLMSDDPLKRLLFNPFWDIESQTGAMVARYVCGYDRDEFLENILSLGPGVRDFSGTEIGYKQTAGDSPGYNFEFRISWATLNGNGNEEPFIPETGSCFTLSIAVNDNDGESRECILSFTSSFMHTPDLQPIVRLDGYLSENRVSVNEALIYPNPSSGYIILKQASEYRSLKIYDNTGRIVIENENPGNEEYYLDIRNLSAGIYYMMLEGRNSELKTLKFIRK